MQFAIPILPQIWGAGGSRALERAGPKTHSDGRILFLATERSAAGRPGVSVVKRGYGGSSNASSTDHELKQMERREQEAATTHLDHESWSTMQEHDHDHYNRVLDQRRNQGGLAGATAPPKAEIIFWTSLFFAVYNK